MRPFLAATAIVVTACSGPSGGEGTDASNPSPRAELIGQGETIARNLCSGCHAVGTEGDSPHREAIPFRQLSWKYRITQYSSFFCYVFFILHNYNDNCLMSMHCILIQKRKIKQRALISTVSFHYRCFHFELFEQTLWLRSGTSWDWKIIFSLSCFY